MFWERNRNSAGCLVLNGLLILCCGTEHGQYVIFLISVASLSFFFFFVGMSR